MGTLRELIETAQADMDRFKHPDTDEVEIRLHEILKAGNLGGISCDQLERLSFYNGMLRIETSYSVRSCAMTGEYEIPESVIDAADPIAAIKVWAKGRRVAKARRALALAENAVERCRQELTKIEQEG